MALMYRNKEQDRHLARYGRIDKICSQTMDRTKGLRHVRLSEVYDGSASYFVQKADDSFREEKEPDPLRTKKIKPATGVTLYEILAGRNT